MCIILFCSPNRADNDISLLNNRYNEKFPKARLQMEERLQVRKYLCLVICTQGRYFFRNSIAFLTNAS